MAVALLLQARDRSRPKLVDEDHIQRVVDADALGAIVHHAEGIRLASIRAIFPLRLPCLSAPVAVFFSFLFFFFPVASKCRTL